MYPPKSDLPMLENAYSQPAENTQSLRMPPQALEAEQSILGSLMQNSERWDQIADTISADDFYRKDHRMIFEAVSGLCEDDQPADVVTVSQWLESRNGLETIGGIAYLGSLVNNTPSATNINAYASIVRERAIIRRLIGAATEIQEMSYEPEGRKAPELLDQAEKKIFDIAKAGGLAKKEAFQPIKGLLAEALDRIDEMYQSDKDLAGISTGFKDLDNLTAGLQAGDLIIVAGRPSMGKTSLAMNLAENIALYEKAPAAIFSMEMPGSQLAMRMMASLGRIDSNKVRTGKLDEEDWPRLTSAINLLEKAPIYIDDSPGLTPLQIRAKARRLARQHEHGLGVIVVDYIQLMQSGEMNENRATEISMITRSLKSLAKELNVPVIALSQLNRSLEQRPDKRPVMADLRESGAIEQDADVIVFIYRDEVYNKESEQKGTAEIIIAKQRNGPIGMVRTTFLGKYTRFEDYAAEFGGDYLP